MPNYQITAPDGRKFEITAPEGASEQDVLAYAQQHYAKPDTAPAEWKPVQRTPEMLRQSAAEYRDRNPVTNDMSGVQTFGAAVGKSLADTGQGFSQLFGQTSREEVDARRATDDQLMNTKAGIGGNFVGSVAQILGPGAVLKGATYAKNVANVPGVVDKLQMGARAFLPTSIRGSAAQGAVIGGLQGVGVDDSRMANIGLGGLLGSAGAAIPKGLGALYRGTGSYLGKPTVSGVNRRAGEIIRAEADNPQNLLKVEPSAIPGARRTLAEETLDPGIARLERNARSTGKGWDSLDRTNNAARVAAIEKFGGNQQALDAAIAARSKASNSLRKEAMQIEGVDTSRLLSQIKRLETLQTGRPAVQAGMAQIRSLLTRDLSEAEVKKAALEPLQSFIASDTVSATNREAAKAAMTMIRNGEVPSAKFIASAGTRGTEASRLAGQQALAEARKAFNKRTAGHDKVAVLDNVRKTIGDMLGGKYGGDSAASLAGSRELMAIKGQLDRVLAKQAPEYGQYLDAFRGGSKPVNRMQVGQSLMNSRSGSAILDPVTGAQVLTPASFSGRARNLDKVAAEATGFRKAKAANILEPEDFTAIRNVQDDLERRAFAATAGSGGNSQTFERMALNDRVAGGLMGRVPVVGRAFEYLAQVGETRLQARLSEILADPAQARAILQSLPANERRTVEIALSRIGGGAGALTPALTE